MRKSGLYTGEYNERCGWCRNSMLHTQADHETEIRLYLKREAERSDALWRAARKQYDAP